MISRIVVVILVVAATATVADWVWYTFGVQHTATAGIVHGALLLTVVGGGLGALVGRTVRGLPIGMLAGIGGALAYELFVALLDGRPYGAAIPASWVVMWLLIAALDGRWLRSPDVRSWVEIALRGVCAAVVSGLSFWLIVGVLWGPPGEGGRNYLVQFSAWAVAWGPGLAALAWSRRVKGDRSIFEEE